MLQNHPFVMTIGGFDPSAGAGVLADIKTFEQHKTYGISVLTCTTLQTEKLFKELAWLDLKYIIRSITFFLSEYPVKVIKIGAIQNNVMLSEIINGIRNYSKDIQIIWDPIIRTSTGVQFWQDEKIDSNLLEEIYLLTPNYEELKILNTHHVTMEDVALELSHTCAILLKGGHHPTHIGQDQLFNKGQKTIFLCEVDKIHYPKHGSGCVLSSAIAAQIAKGYDLINAIKLAKDYISTFLNSQPTLLGTHYV